MQRRKNRLLLMGIALCLFAQSCTSFINKDDVKIEIEDLNRPKFVKLSLELNPENFDRIEWGLPDGEKISQRTQFTTHYPKKGEYIINVKISKGEKSTDIKKKITIDNDDIYLQGGEQLLWNEEFNGNSLNIDWWKRRCR